MYVRTVLVFAALCADFFNFADALKPGDPGVCVAKSTHTQRTRWKVFYVQSKKMCGKKRCVVKKSRRESYAVKSQPICCSGWEYRSEDDSCSPLCSTGCDGGRCVSPDVCRCEPPAVLDEEHRNACILPTCEPACINSVCIADNRCECNAGYLRHNTTHCYHCEPGYTISEDFSCAPVCDHPCTNGHCIGPNICGCLTGYLLKDTFTCEPICEGPCINSVCTSPNVCSCLEGYTASNGSCRPRCDSCDNGRCVAPDVCECDDGYTNGTGRCEPVCDEDCINGVCTEPNLCTCDKGYVADDSGSKCVKECASECKGSCDEDGKCLDCSVPFGIRNYQVRVGRGKTVDKQLRKTMCCDDWKFDFASKKCVFYCRLGCERGKCIGPNRCSCDPPYELVDGNCVEMVCDPPCSNGRCAGNNTCLCDPDYEQLNTTHCAPKCQPGYVHPCANGSCTSDTDPSACVPKCEPECENGECVEPGVCSCSEGYRNESSWSCAPVCDSCDNGNCTAPNVCECFEGYSKNLTGACTPTCEMSCTNGFCSSPNVCSCNTGYLESSGKCVPVCSEPCVNGYCESPEQCACNPGYVRSNGSASSCRKECPGPCYHGTCTVYGTCECDRGFKLENGTCESIPEEPVDCESCSGNCTDGSCRCVDGSICYLPPNVESAEVASSSRLAGLELSWVVGGAVSFLLIILVISIFGHMWRRRKEYGAKSTDEKGNTYGSVVYTVPNTLLNMGDDGQERDYDGVNDPEPSATERALLDETDSRDQTTYK